LAVPTVIVGSANDLTVEEPMPTPFGPQLIGETEKTLGALLRRFLEDTGLTEPRWVTLRVAGVLDGTVDADGLAAAVADRTHFADADQLVADLTNRDLLDAGRLSARGRELVERVQDRVGRGTAPIWEDLPDEDVAAATRLLNEVITRARTVLVGSPK
jgi:hypothetical protein